MKMKMAIHRRTILHAMVLVFVSGLVNSRDSDLLGNYCRGRLVECCSGRDDSCTVPILGTLCYCDTFCDSHPNPDCCPDYWDVCVGIPEPDPQNPPKCTHKSRSYNSNESFKDNCNTCTCRQLNNGQYDFFCSSKPCLIRSDIIDGVNSGNYGWQSSNYTFLWGKTLDEGIQFRLGTFPPSKSTINMTEIHTPMWNYLPRFFDSRLKWATWLQPIRDQGDCGASWAFSSAALASDRLAVMSGGLWKVNLSPQMLISCQSRGQNGCKGGHLDRAWWYLRKHGVSSESCYPYHSGKTSKAGSCKAKKLRASDSKIPKVRCADGSENILYLSTPPYRTAAQERIIMQEIYNNGPVQATFHVKEDFYSYKAGVYRYSKLSESLPEDYRQEGWHSVRIIGWGEDTIDNAAVKYWLCANSWGSHWGEEGYFRILRGVNECDIESFVVGVWANLEEFDDKITIEAYKRHGSFV